MQQLNYFTNQNQKIAKLIGWLLPMLINGQITFCEFKSELGMVAEEGGEYQK